MSSFGLKCYDGSSKTILDTTIGLTQIITYVQVQQIISSTIIYVSVPGLDPNIHDVYIHGDFWSWYKNDETYPVQSQNPSRIWTTTYTRIQGYYDYNSGVDAYSGSVTLLTNQIKISNDFFPTTTAEWVPTTTYIWDHIWNGWAPQARLANFHIYVTNK